MGKGKKAKQLSPSEAIKFMEDFCNIVPEDKKFKRPLNPNELKKLYYRQIEERHSYFLKTRKSRSKSQE